MAIDYRITAKELVEKLGGDNNIVNVSHCATRLRFILKDESVVDSAKVTKIPGMITTVQAGGQYQVVIGNHVKDAFGFVMELITVDENAGDGAKNKVGVFNRVVDVISSIFAPFLYTFKKYRLSFGFSLPFIVHIVYPVLYRGFPHLVFVWDIFYKAFRVQSHFFCHADFFIPDTAFFLCLIPQFLLICHFFFPSIVQGNPTQGLSPSYPRISQAALPRHLT